MEISKYDEEDKIESLNKIVAELRNEILGKDTYIKRLNKRNEDFENEVLEFENRDTQILKEQKDIISYLNKNLMELQNNLCLHEEQLETRCQEVLTLEKRIRDKSANG